MLSGIGLMGGARLRALALVATALGVPLAGFRSKAERDGTIERPSCGAAHAQPSTKTIEDHEAAAGDLKKLRTSCAPYPFRRSRRR